MSSDHTEDFQASVHLLELGAVHVRPTASQSMRFHRTPKLIRQSDPELLHMSLVARGTVGMVQHGQETTHDPGDVCVLIRAGGGRCLAGAVPHPRHDGHRLLSALRRSPAWEHRGRFAVRAVRPRTPCRQRPDPGIPSVGR
ncbi:hypothetical protein [Streptomyces sp. OE57]|uniref:AraC-like ligand-binding domain-containing protein n=1 Tax=Streptomyces lacaronensis TaxID=3379885 RepID=UPI0039B72DB0